MEGWAAYFLIAIALGTDAFSLSLGLGMCHPSSGAILRISFVVGVFHVLMPLVGLLVGNFLGAVVGKVAIWIGGLILIILGVRMIWEGWPRRSDLCSFSALGELLAKPKDPFGIKKVLLLGWCVSVDALGVGVGLGTIFSGLTSGDLAFFVVMLGTVAALMTALGLLLGRWLGHQVGKGAEVLGGLVLTGIGIKMFF